MANLVPTQIFAGYDYQSAGESLIADSLVIPLAALPGLTASEADADLGDGRKIAFEIVKQIESAYTALASTERPAKMQASQSNPVGVSPTTVRRTFTVSFEVDISTADVTAE